MATVEQLSLTGRAARPQSRPPGTLTSPSREQALKDPANILFDCEDYGFLPELKLTEAKEKTE